MNTLLEVLKEETTTLHREIEQTAVMKNMFSPHFQQSDYVLLLHKWHGLTLNIEHHIKQRFEELEVILPDIKKRLKTPLIEADLSALGVNTQKTIQEEPEMNLYQLLGALYVIEGSSLGAKMITVQLQKHSFINSKNCQFYAGYKKETGQMWSDFKAAVNQWGEKNLDAHSEIVKGAKHTFTKLKESFTNKDQALL